VFPRAPSRATRRHCRRRTVLDLSAHARRRSTTLVAPPGSSVAPVLANCPASRPLAGFPEPLRPPPPAAAETRRGPLLRPNSGIPQLLGVLLAEPGRSPGRQLRRLAGAGRARVAPLAKGRIAIL
jgi:hypothetical protein